MAMHLFTDKTKRTDRARPSKRVPLRIRFRVSGRDEYGFTFEDYVETIDISAGGGCLIFNKDVKKGEYLKLYSPKGTAFRINVRWFKYDMRKDVRYLGFKLMEPAGRWVLT